MASMSTSTVSSDARRQLLSRSSARLDTWSHSGHYTVAESWSSNRQRWRWRCGLLWQHLRDISLHRHSGKCLSGKVTFRETSVKLVYHASVLLVLLWMSCWIYRELKLIKLWGKLAGTFHMKPIVVMNEFVFNSSWIVSCHIGISSLLNMLNWSWLINQ